MIDKNLLMKIENSQSEYLKCYCEKYDENNKIRYIDKALVDMYDYNCIYVKKTESQKELYKIIESEKNYRQENGYKFCRIYMKDKPQLYNFDDFYKEIEVEHNGIYVYEPMKSPDWKSLNGYTLKKVVTEAQVKDLINMDIISNSKYCGEEFCIKRSSHHGEIFLSDDKPLNCYVCYHNNIPVGHCELMIKDKTAKIEDFEVLEDYRKKGIGRTIMKYVINEALKNHAEVIYLVADEDDTVKDMYMNMGFYKAADEYAILINFN